MAYTEIPVNRNAVYGSQLMNAMQVLQTAVNQLAILAAKANTMIDQAQNPANYLQVETQFGLPTTDGGSGTSSVGYSLVYQLNAVNTILANATITQMLAQVG
jgi:hypothetical protein